MSAIPGDPYAPPPVPRNETTPQERPGYSGPMSRYGGPGRGGWTWHSDADIRFGAENFIDPQTGLIFGPGADGLPPAGIALHYQAAHDRAIWLLRQRMMRSGLNYAQGALGLLQSFRPGGGAAIEAGIYNTLAGLEFQRASQTQPLDLLGDYRRHEAAVSRQRANRAQERQLAVQIAATAATAATGLWGAALFSGAMAANRAAGTPTVPGTTPRPEGATMPVTTPGVTPAGGEMIAAPPATGQAPAIAPAMSGGVGPNVPQPQTTQPPTAPGPSAPPSMPPGPAAPPQQPGSPAASPGQSPSQGQPQGGLPSMQAPVGADGNFTQSAYAVKSAGVLLDPVQQLALQRAAADLYETDPFFATFTYAVNRRWMQRLGA